MEEFFTLKVTLDTFFSFGMAKKGVLKVARSGHFFTLRTACAHPAHTLRTPCAPCAYPAHTLRTPCAPCAHLVRTLCKACAASPIIPSPTTLFNYLNLILCHLFRPIAGHNVRPCFPHSHAGVVGRGPCLHQLQGLLPHRNVGNLRSRNMVPL